MTRKFIKLTVRNLNGRLYYSIVYLDVDDNGVGHDYEGYSSYSLDIISDYLKKYFMPSVQPEPCEELDFVQEHKKIPVVLNIQQKEKSMPSVQPEQRWIPCSERFPDREMPVWVSMCDYDVLKAIWRNGWCASNGYKLGLTDRQVIAWMPRQIIPEPYWERGEE